MKLKNFSGKKIRSLLICGGFISLILISISLISGCGSNKSDLKIYAIKYGESLFPENYMFKNGSRDRKSKFTWLCYYVEYKDRKILIDTGFNDPSYIRLFNIKNFSHPANILRQNGIQAELITDIIITHGHFDHSGGVADYPLARIIISSSELIEIKKGTYGRSIRAEFLNRKSVTEFDNEFVLDSLITIKKISGHSPGSAVVYLESGNNRFCFTGDEVYSVKNLHEKIANGSVTDLAGNTNFINNYDFTYIPLTFHNPELYGNNQNFIKIAPR